MNRSTYVVLGGLALVMAFVVFKEHRHFRDLNQLEPTLKPIARIHVFTVSINHDGGVKFFSYITTAVDEAEARKDLSRFIAETYPGAKVLTRDSATVSDRFVDEAYRARH